LGRLFLFDMDKKAAYNYLCQFITEQRRNLIESRANERTNRLTLVLQDIFHPHNVNAVLRTSDCLGLRDIHVIEGKYAFKTSQNISKGASKWVNVYRHPDEAACLHTLHKAGYVVFAASPHHEAATPVNVDLSKPIALIFGSEKLGLSSYVLKHADGIITLPMVGFTESLNVSVAAALCAYEITRRLRNEGHSWQLTESESDELKLEWAMRSARSAEALLMKYAKDNNI